MKKIVLLVFVILSFDSFSQDFGEVGASWHYTKHFSFSKSKSYVKVESIKDSIIQGKSCHQLSLSGGHLCNYHVPTAFVYSEDSVVYFLTEETNRFEKLYDFTTKKDSSWTIKYRLPFESYDDSVQVKVDSIGKKEINGRDLKLLYVTYYNNTSIPGGARKSMIVEKIGDINYMFNWFTCIDGQVAFGLRCYQDPTFGVYTTWIAPSCTATEVPEYPKSTLLNLYPNPTSTILNVELLHTSNYEIIEIGGRIIRKNSLEKGLNSIDVRHLKAGIYFLQVEYKGEIKSFKFMKE